MIDDTVGAWMMHNLPDPMDGINERRPSWHARAACRGAGVDMFITDPGTPTEPARAVCGACTVREPCLATHSPIRKWWACGAAHDGGT